MFRASTGAYERTLGGPDVFGEVYGMCVKVSTDELFLANYGKDKIDVYRASNGAHVRSFGASGAGAAQFSAPACVCLSPNGEDLYVTEWRGARVQVLRAADGAHVRNLDFKFSSPYGICTTSDGQLLVGDSQHHRVCAFGL